jgi:uncharacterized protein YjbJ (UPF0337 family)
MPMNKDELKGRAKETAGVATDDKALKREGKVEKTAGKAKQAIDKAAEKAKEEVRKRS